MVLKSNLLVVKHQLPKQLSHIMNPNELSLLVVEPSDLQRKIIIKELKQQGITQVAEAKNIAQAYETAKKHPRDLITSAMYFDDGSAIDLLHQIRNNPSIADTPFMLVSSELRRESLEEFKQSGVIALLPKPFTSAHLATAIDTTIDLLSTDELELEYFDVHEVRVLLVDDSRLARNHIKRVLNNLGLLKIVEAADGSEAIALLKESNVTILADNHLCSLEDVSKITDDSVWYEEFLDYKILLGEAKDLEDAIDKINLYGGGHSAAILTENEETASYFMNSVDSAAVYHNASTRFTDGGQFGLGGELAISTDKLHQRGPIGLQHLVTNKWYVKGNGQIR